RRRTRSRCSARRTLPGGWPARTSAASRAGPRAPARGVTFTQTAPGRFPSHRTGDTQVARRQARSAGRPVIVLVLSAVALVLMAKTWATLDEFFSKYPHAWRYASGNYLGKRHGREPLTRRRRVRRAGIRTGILLAIIALAWAYTFHRRGTVETLTVTG